MKIPFRPGGGYRNPFGPPPAWNPAAYGSCSGSPRDPVDLPVVVVYDGSNDGGLTAKVEGWQPIGKDEVPGERLYAKLETNFGCYLDAIVYRDDSTVQEIKKQLDDAVAKVVSKLGDEFREGSLFYEFVKKYHALNQALDDIAKESHETSGPESICIGIGAIVKVPRQLQPQP